MTTPPLEARERAVLIVHPIIINQLKRYFDEKICAKAAFCNIISSSNISLLSNDCRNTYIEFRRTRMARR